MFKKRYTKPENSSYQKNHPVVEGSDYTQLEFGSRPGSTTPVFETDFGKIGVQICFNIEYREGWDVLARSGAEIIFWLSAYDGGCDLNAMAWNYHRCVASAVHSRHARIIDIMGETLSITGDHESIAFAAVDLDVALFHMDFNKSQIPAIRKKYGSNVSLRLYHSDLNGSDQPYLIRFKLTYPFLNSRSWREFIFHV